MSMSNLDADLVLAEIADSLSRLADVAEARERREVEAAAAREVVVPDLGELPALELSSLPALDLEGDADGVELLDADGEPLPLPTGLASVRLRGQVVGAS